MPDKREFRFRMQRVIPHSCSVVPGKLQRGRKTTRIHVGTCCDQRSFDYPKRMQAMNTGGLLVYYEDIRFQTRADLRRKEAI